MIQVHIHTLIVSGSNASSIVVLKPLERSLANNIFRIVPIWIGSNEATQLSIALEQATLSRPMTHSLFLDAITNLDACIDHVIINDVRKSTFFSRLYLRHHTHLINLDARPSDSLALAIRQQAPIYISERVLEKASFPYIVRNQTNPEEEIDSFRAFLENVDPKDFESFDIRWHNDGFSGGIGKFGKGR